MSDAVRSVRSRSRVALRVQWLDQWTFRRGGGPGRYSDRDSQRVAAARSGCSRRPRGIRRLTAAEIDLSIRELLEDDDANAGLVLPEDVRTPFDNDAQTQLVSEALIGGAELLASDAAARLVADDARFERVVGCAPQTADGEACLRAFVARWGRLALRRSLTSSEVDLFVSGVVAGDGPLDLASETDDFRDAVGFVVQALLQDPEFLYRVEVGTSVSGMPGLFRLSDTEVAVRLSFLLWGTGPDDTLLSLAEAGGTCHA